eukprot:CAMPEP_0113529302 /NCGR_PEP_ID=MMETSP0015_2-20120614/2320_1 /TAXON_ID=2838 /ORGANISM="Odontella" /LENGTH=305 /DNA_ID=CAMNT_0000427921 /DNA_START=78 /DNA_END=995 /DNA_ORIENTATION=+ /assembly_acc=CAM_ASM_000160
MCGPTDTSNWVVQNALMAGAQPDIIEDISWKGNIKVENEEELKKDMNLIECAINLGRDGSSTESRSGPFEIKDYESARWLNKELANGQLNWGEYDDPTFVARRGDQIAWDVIKKEEKDVMMMVYMNREGDLKRILRAGIDTFVCLQSELSPPPLPYEQAANEWCRENQLAERTDNGKEHQEIRSLKFLHLPTRDGSTFEESALHSMVDQISRLIHAGQKLYVHCRGGHGRTGVLVACVLGALFPSMGAKEVLERVQTYHDCRAHPQGELMTIPSSPQTPDQVSQVKKYLRGRKRMYFNLFFCNRK